MFFHKPDIDSIEKKVPDSKLIGAIIKLKILCCISQVYVKNPTKEPIHPNKRDVKDIYKIKRQI